MSDMRVLYGLCPTKGGLITGLKARDVLTETLRSEWDRFTGEPINDNTLIIRNSRLMCRDPELLMYMVTVNGRVAIINLSSEVIYNDRPVNTNETAMQDNEFFSVRCNIDDKGQRTLDRKHMWFIQDLDLDEDEDENLIHPSNVTPIITKTDKIVASDLNTGVTLLLRSYIFNCGCTRDEVLTRIPTAEQNHAIVRYLKGVNLTVAYTCIKDDNSFMNPPCTAFDYVATAIHNIRP